MPHPSSALATHRLERREHKYHLSPALVPALREALRTYCVLDGYADPTTGSYAIDSLYLDSPDFAFFKAYAQEHENRFKLRIRTYPGSPGAPVFVEAKHRANEAVYKLRGKLDAADWASRLASPTTEDSSDALQHFTALATRYDARPVTVVRYRREAWISTIDPYARVTFDTHVRAAQSDSLSFPPADDAGTTWRACDSAAHFSEPSSSVILELKFLASAIPRWMIALVQRFDLDRRAFSKYGAAIRAWFGSPALRGASGRPLGPPTP